MHRGQDRGKSKRDRTQRRESLGEAVAQLQVLMIAIMPAVKTHLMLAYVSSIGNTAATIQAYCNPVSCVNVLLCDHSLIS